MPITLNGTTGIVNDATNLNYTGTLTGGMTGGIVAHLVAAIQEQQAIIQSLTARITALEGAAV